MKPHTRTATLTAMSDSADRCQCDRASSVASCSATEHMCSCSLVSAGCCRETIWCGCMTVCECSKNEVLVCDACVPGSNRCCLTSEERRRACLTSHHDGPKMCRGAEHVCVCLVRGSKSCRGSAKHKCCCRRPDEHGCLSAKHICVCENKGPSFCQTGMCHHCVCLKWGPELCRSHLPWHYCVCRVKGPDRPCRAEHHTCACGKFSWRACRRWGKHLDRLSEARGVRALVVASYGSAPSAEINGPVLNGFAGLPHQLRLYVAEIAWVMAAAGTENVRRLSRPSDVHGLGQPSMSSPGKAGAEND